MKILAWQLKNLIEENLTNNLAPNTGVRCLDARYDTIKDAVAAQAFIEGLVSQADSWAPDVRDSGDFARVLWATASIIQSQRYKDDPNQAPFSFWYILGYIGPAQEYYAMNLAVTGTSEQNLAVYLVDPITGEFRYVKPEDKLIDLVLI